jgi:hypothetical protein
LVSHIKGRVFENRVLRRVFGLKRDEKMEKVAQWELHNLYSSPNTIRHIK